MASRRQVQLRKVLGLAIVNASRYQSHWGGQSPMVPETRRHAEDGSVNV